MKQDYQFEKWVNIEEQETRAAGFTLLELLVALTILSFLIAATVFRFGDFTGQGLATVTRMNQADLVNYITVDLQHDNAYPRGLINIVSVDRTSGTYSKPMVSDMNPENAPEVLAYQMDRRHQFYIHYLNDSEAAMLREMGIVSVCNYNSPYDRDVSVGAPEVVAVAAGIAVLMTGGGDSDGNGVIEATEVSQIEPDRGHPEEMFRMVFGLGSETTLIRDGLVFNASTCPESGLAPINYVWHWYALLLPRLEATAHRLKADNPLGSDGTVTTYGVQGTKDSTDLVTARKRHFDLYTDQDRSYFAVMDAEGATYPGGEITGWGVDFDNNGQIE